MTPLPEIQVGAAPRQLAAGSLLLLADRADDLDVGMEPAEDDDRLLRVEVLHHIGEQLALRPADLDQLALVRLKMPGRDLLQAEELDQRVRGCDLLAANALVKQKSTRLNSSHVKISYAVFCLKKKKNTRT